MSGSDKISNSFEVVITCPVCGSRKRVKLYKIEYTSNEVIEVLDIVDTSEIFLYKCVICNHHFASPVIKQELLNKYYLTSNNEYYNKHVVPVNNRSLQNENIVKDIEKVKNGGDILEIGCGYGFLLNTFNSDKWNRYGIEPTPLAVKYAAETFNLKIHQGVLEPGLFDNKKFDVILLFDVIEHLPEPNEFLNMIRKSLKHDGALVIGTGNISSFNAVIGGPIWNYFCTYLHISFFSEKSIRYLLEKNNFDIFKIYKRSYLGTNRDNLKILLRNIIKALLNRVFSVGKNFRILNSFDHMVVIAKNSKQS